MIFHYKGVDVGLADGEALGLGDTNEKGVDVGVDVADGIGVSAGAGTNEGHSANSQFGPSRPRALPSGQILASIVQAVVPDLPPKYCDPKMYAAARTNAVIKRATLMTKSGDFFPGSAAAGAGAGTPAG